MSYCSLCKSQIRIAANGEMLYRLLVASNFRTSGANERELAGNDFTPKAPTRPSFECSSAQLKATSYFMLLFSEAYNLVYHKPAVCINIYI